MPSEDKATSDLKTQKMPSTFDVSAAQQRLTNVPRSHCEATNLRREGTLNVAACFECSMLSREWHEVVSARLQALAIPDTAAGVNPGDRRALYYLVRCLRPDDVLEIGTHIGASTTHMALGLHMNGMGTLRTIDIYDVNDDSLMPWIAFGATLSPAAMTRVLGCADAVEFSRLGSLEDLAATPPSRRYDLVFLDGNHDAAHVYQEISLVLSHLAKDGVLVVHDYFPQLRPLWSNAVVIPGVTLAIDRLIKEGVRLSVKPLGRLPWATKLESNITSLALVERAA